MKSYKLDDYESEITNVFLEKLTQTLNARDMVMEYVEYTTAIPLVNIYNLLQPKNDEFTMDQNFIHPFKVVFKYSDIKLEDIELPSHLNLDEFLTKI